MGDMTARQTEKETDMHIAHGGAALQSRLSRCKNKLTVRKVRPVKPIIFNPDQRYIKE